MSHLNFGIFCQFCPILTCLGNTVLPQASGFQKFAKMDQFWHFLWSTQNVNVARFARNVECDFFCDFQTLCNWVHTSKSRSFTVH